MVPNSVCVGLCVCVCKRASCGPLCVCVCVKAAVHKCYVHGLIWCMSLHVPCSCTFIKFVVRLRVQMYSASNVKDDVA